MKNAQIRVIFVLAALFTVGIIMSQIYGIKKAYNQENERFELNATVALRDVAFKVWELKQSQSTIYNAVVKIDKEHYVVKINENVESEILEHFLKESFTNNGVYTDFVYGLHDCLNHVFKYQKYVKMSNKTHTAVNLGNFNPPNIDNYYFVVYFPYRSAYLTGELTIWIASSLLILATLVFLCYVVYVVLSQKRLGEMQKDFVMNMTHEFKTPLTSIQLAANTLKKPNIVEKPLKLANYATIIDTEAKKLQLQVERVLQMSMGEKKELNLDMKLIDLKAILTKTCEAYGTQLENRDGCINLNIGNNPIMILADALHLETVFSNLIDNAIKYTPENQNPHISISVKNMYRKSVFITIRDQGMGIDETNLKYIFKRFYRVSTGNIHNIKGFGIGLNYVKSILDLHHGKIKVESGLGRGTIFTISLPKPKA